MNGAAACPEGGLTTGRGRDEPDCQHSENP
jgi:hypothetical protein